MVIACIACTDTHPSAGVQQRIPETDWVVTAFSVSRANGSSFSGDVTTHNTTTGLSDTLKWEAIYHQEGIWGITGPGAKQPSGGRVPNRKDYPFSFDPRVNVGLQQVTVENLNRYKETAKKPATGGNGTSGEISTAPPVSTIGNPALDALVRLGLREKVTAMDLPTDEVIPWPDQPRKLAPLPFNPRQAQYSHEQ